MRAPTEKLSCWSRKGTMPTDKVGNQNFQHKNLYIISTQKKEILVRKYSFYFFNKSLYEVSLILLVYMFGSLLWT